MWEFVSNGGFFDCPSLRKHDPNRCSLIRIVKFEDGRYYIRDGLHRVTLVHALGRELREDEYSVERRHYDDFRVPNLAAGWITPFDPITEVRLADFHSYKEEASQMDGQLERFVLANRSRYCTPRLPKHNLDKFSKELKCLLFGFPCH